MKFKLCLCLPALIVCFSALSQSRSDTSFVALAKQYARGLHEAALGTQARLYNGSRYVDPVFNDEEHPFFLSEDWLTGSVVYDGEEFIDVPLMFDMMNQALVAEHRPSGHAIRLIDEKLTQFSINGRKFERIEIASVQNSLPASGPYEVLYDGPSKLLARRVKFRRDNIEAHQVVVSYELRERYFILRNGVYFPVRKKSSLLRVLSDKKQQLKHFLKQQGLRFSSERERALIAAAEFYDSSR